VYIDNAEQAVTLMKSLSRIRPYAVLGDSITSHSLKLKQLNQCESFEKVARLSHAHLSNMCLS